MCKLLVLKVRGHVFDPLNPCTGGKGEVTHKQSSDPNVHAEACVTHTLTLSQALTHTLTYIYTHKLPSHAHSHMLTYTPMHTLTHTHTLYTQK